MREILFRGKDKYNGEWIEGYYYLSRSKYAGDKSFVSEVHTITTGITEVSGAYGEHSETIKSSVIPETVGQYTGLTDKNGTKIFEGDILESPIGRKAIVSFGTYKPWSTKDSDDFECWKLTLIAKNEGETKLECGLGKHCMEYMRLIGNIHDNPELLKVGD